MKLKKQRKDMAHEHHHHGQACSSCEHHHEHEHGGMKRQLALIVLTAVLLIVAVVIEHNTDMGTWQLLLVYLVPYLIVGHDTLKEAWKGITEGNPFNEHLLMAVATLGALGIGFLPGAETEFPEAVFVMLFFQVGELFEGYAEGKSRESISHLMDIRPDVAHLVISQVDCPRVKLTEGQSPCEVRDVSPEQVRVGDTILVRRGEKIPLDGIIAEGETSLSTVALTGESLPREARQGDEVYSGCINMKSDIRIRTTKTFGESTVSKILDLVEHASEHKSESEAFITRFAHIYTPVVVILAVLLAVVPVLLGGVFSMWLYRALLFLVVSCPCALVLSVPLTFFGGIGGASRRGILIKGAKYMDVLVKVDTVAFDKTGTLTHGQVIDEHVVNDQVKSDSAEAIRLLHGLGVHKIVMLTGDRQEVADRVARQLGLTEYYAELLPTDKVAHVERLLQEGGTLAFVGDGINDAPVLARADIGIAMGALGSDAAIEAADVVLMDDQPTKIATAIRIARRTLAIARQNVWFAIGVKVAVLVLAALGLATMWMAVFADVGVTVLAVLNAMRTLKC